MLKTRFGVDDRSGLHLHQAFTALMPGFICCPILGTRSCTSWSGVWMSKSRLSYFDEGS